MYGAGHGRPAGGGQPGETGAGLDTHGRPDAGLLFVAWQADPASFIKVQTKLDGADHLTRFIRHESSAVFAVPGGAAPDQYVGQHLLEG